MKDCPFCNYEGPSPILFSFEDGYVIEPLNPVTPGHVLFIPFTHVGSTVERPSVLGRMAQEAARYAVTQGGGPCNIIASHGLAATQTVFHLHVHLVPRRAGDGLALPWSAT